MVAKFVDDPTLDWPTRYQRLGAHHIAETTEMHQKLIELRAEVVSLKLRWAFSPQNPDLEQNLQKLAEATYPHLLFEVNVRPKGDKS
jgi:hypothetical protein